MGPVITKSARLKLRSWTPEDAPALVALLSDAEVSRFINAGKPATLEDATRFIERYMRIQSERGWCRWALELAEQPGALAGFCGVGCTFAPEIELGWTLRRDLWGRGLATEAARAALDYCFSAVGFTRIISAIDSENARSAAVAARLGMVRDGFLEHEGHRIERWAIGTPLETPPAQPGFVRSCEGEPSGSSLNASEA